MSEPIAVRVVTDSTACLPDAAARDAGIAVVPLRVLAGDDEWREGVEISPDEVARRIGAGERLTTSQPPPAALLAAYREAAAAGARAVVSVHLSGALSGTVGAAEHAGHRAMLPVRVVDSGTVAMALGFAATEAAACAAAGHDAAHVAARAAEVAGSSETVFLVDSLDHLRRGGRLSAPAAALGTALGVRPLLGVRDGRIELLQRVRTRAAATARLVERAARHAEGLERPGVAVHHLGVPDRADEVAEELHERLGVDVVVSPVSAVLGAHAGPGALAVAVAELGTHRH
ncbi:DegV family protein [Isoptericola variabilis]|uniref:DegV family protein n=1 Tax=Isoptericola variabilis (strain 225) TaxID=743718 RepID=F6FPK1_ISOV2|nr:DegV family protein [Isoptericola variabilis]AEG44733.1 degV family protein [Isoptericola variabilis 225]TWH32345.1 DegV family protein with EDD domain [Isoptericola variabilis J7]